MHGMQKKAGNWVGEFIAAIKSDSFSFANYLADYRETARVIETSEKNGGVARVSMD